MTFFEKYGSQTGDEPQFTYYQWSGWLYSHTGAKYQAADGSILSRQDMAKKYGDKFSLRHYEDDGYVVIYRRAPGTTFRLEPDETYHIV